MALFYRFLFFIIGLLIMTFGVCLTIKADLGAGAWDALNVALSEEIGLSIGKWVMIDGAILILVNAILVKRKPELLSLITVIFIGSLIDFWMFIIFETWVFEGFFIKLAALLAGIIIIGFGVAAYLQAKFPSSPIDNFMLAIKERFGFNLIVSKTLAELIPLIPAIILGGPVWVGTIIITLSIGPAIQLFFPSLEKLVKNLQERKLQEKY
jgi:uncharacterized protein